MKFRKIPVVIDAWQIVDDASIHGVLKAGGEVQRHAFQTIESKNIDYQGKPLAVFDSFHGWVPFSYGDWIIKGVEGEFYPCVDETFRKTYEEVSDQEVVVNSVLGLAIESAALHTVAWDGKEMSLRHPLSCLPHLDCKVGELLANYRMHPDAEHGVYRVDLGVDNKSVFFEKVP